MNKETKDPKNKKDVDTEELTKLAAEKPETKKWNNPNSRKNLVQYKDESTIDPLEAEILSQTELEDQEDDEQANEITRGRKLSPKIVKKLIPKRGVLLPGEKSRYTGIIITFLSDFKNEEPTASDVSDILEIALCETMEGRLFEASKNDPGSLVACSQALERFYKRKQTAKENLANRRSDRKDTRLSQEINIVDIVSRYDAHRQQVEKQRMEELLLREEKTSEVLKKIIEEDPF